MSLTETICCGLACLLLAPGWIVLLWQQDAWPYSCYPMFSGYLTPERVVVYRIAVELAGGERIWWRPRYDKVQEMLGREFQALARLDGPTPEQCRREADLIARVVHLVQRDPPRGGGAPRAVAALCVFRRTVTTWPGGAFGVQEELFRRYPLPDGWGRRHSLPHPGRAAAPAPPS